MRWPTQIPKSQRLRHKSQVCWPRNKKLANIQSLENRRDELMSEAEALNLALAQARDEIDVAAEEARRKASEREALEALIASLRKDKADASTTIDEQTQRLEELTTQLSEAEAAKLVSAAPPKSCANGWRIRTLN